MSSTTMVSTHALPVLESSRAERKAGGKHATAGSGAAKLKQMRKGTKSCRECRRRKIKCNYPSLAQADSEDLDMDQTAIEDPASSVTPGTKCIECTTHGRVCEIQGIVDGLNGNNKDVAASSQPKAIYKRRRSTPSTGNSGPGASASDDAESEQQDARAVRPRVVKVSVDRIHSVAQRLARGSEDGSTRSTEADIALMEAYDRIGSYDYVAACNGILHDCGTSGDSSCDDPQLAHTMDMAQSQIQHQHDLESELASKNTSPILCQVFNNNMFTQTTLDHETLSSKFQVLTFSDNFSKSDAEKLTSTISSEPYIMEALDISTQWWISWRDQAFALHEVFLDPDFLPRHTSATDALDSNIGGGTKKKPIPISLQDFVHAKLAQTDDVIAIATGLLAVAMSLQVLRPGVDDHRLHLSCSPSEMSDRIVLAVDTIVLSPRSNTAYMSHPSILLLLMERCKIYAESNQVRKSWVTLRTAITAAKNMGFADPQKRLQPSQTFVGVPNAAEGESLIDAASTNRDDVAQLVVRQRFLGSILELDRLMSMVLGFPYYEDENFTDRLALSVLRGETGPQSGEDDETEEPHTVDIKMRALRRMVAIAAGRVNDRNVRTSSGNTDDETLHAETMNIQAMLSEIAGAMPMGWWDVDMHMQAVSTSPYSVHEHLMAQMWYWQTQVFLNVPFMLKHSPIGCETDIYQANRVLCFAGCRGMLRIFNLARSTPSLAVYICNCDDFQGVLTTCILLVGLLFRESLCPERHDQTIICPGLGDINDSLALVEETKDIFRYRALKQGGFISKQGLKVVVELGSFLDDTSTAFDGEPKRRVVIMPYFGTINLEFGPSTYLLSRVTDPMTATEQEMKSTVGLPLTPLISSNGYSDEGGVAAAATAMESLPGIEAVDLPDYSEHLDFQPSLSGIHNNTDSLSNNTFHFEMGMGDSGLDWDQFLFGDELGRDWNTSIPEWYTMIDSIQ